MNNAFCGETTENVYSRQDVEIVNDVDRYIKVLENFKFVYAVEFDDDLVTAQKFKGKVNLIKII